MSSSDEEEVEEGEEPTVSMPSSAPLENSATLLFEVTAAEDELLLLLP